MRSIVLTSLDKKSIILLAVVIIASFLKIYNLMFKILIIKYQLREKNSRGISLGRIRVRFF